PLYHASPLMSTRAAHRFGGMVVIVDKFDAEETLQFIEIYSVTHMICVPNHFLRMLQLPDEVREKYDISSLRCVMHTGAPCPVETKYKIIEWFGPIVIEIYAGTERIGGTMIRSEEWLAHPGSIGRVASGAAHVLDEKTWEEVPNGDIGVIYFDSGEEFSYHGDDAKSRALYSPQGWRTLGDIGRMDADGYIYLTDRKANMIISGGVNIYPQESENRLLTHPKVIDVAVFGIPNDDFGEEVKAVVQPAPGVKPEKALERELIAYCKEVLAPLKCPRSIDFERALPRQDNGKLYKHKLLQRYR
ncbi:MAG: AMP-binding protein, partial [Pseudomonadota bacterium]